MVGAVLKLLNSSHPNMVLWKKAREPESVPPSTCGYWLQWSPKTPAVTGFAPLSWKEGNSFPTSRGKSNFERRCTLVAETVERGL
ncbi:hypothetical protein L484_000775 [Morus notabilis]|uniref:Uncharacterized protein n=1 Tax=Morus notabilis TaxID=981085 RepID=W9S6U0_9ROSA|nr:hypothetical protein L484_000775 [Morus notabilis]